MIKVRTEYGEEFNPKTSEILSYEPKEYKLEHSLVSIQKWESKWHVSFLNTEDKTNEQMLDYVRCMVVDNDENDNLYCLKFLSMKEFKRISDYMNNPMTATTINQKGHRSRDIITAEIVYYWMTELNIPPEYRFWHFNQLLMLIQVCSIKRQPPKKMGKHETAKSNHAINQARKKRLGTTG